MNKLIIKRIVILVSSCVLVIIGIIAICYASVVSNAEGRTYDSVDSIPHNRVGLLLATSPITPGGAHNFYFENRIKAAEELFRSGKVDLIIASGGDYTQTVKNGCDEPKAIRDSLVSRGIAADRIILDYDGTRTINSIAKAKEIYRLDTLTIISQRYHNERAIYLADKYGLHAIGFNAEPSPIRRNRIKNTLREYLARVKMFIDVFQNKPMKFNHEVSESENNLLYNRIFLPFKGNKVKLQLADYQLTAIFFCQIRTTFAQQNLKIPLKIHRRSPPIQRQKLISQFLTPYNLRNSEQREAEVSCRCCGNISHDHSGAEALPGRLCQRKPH